MEDFKIGCFHTLDNIDSSRSFQPKCTCIQSILEKNLCGTKMKVCFIHAKQENCQKGMMQFSWQTKVREIKNTTTSPLLVVQFFQKQ